MNIIKNVLYFNYLKEKISHMKKTVFLYVSLLNFCCLLYGQTNAFDEKSFFENMKASYYSLQSTPAQNISVLLTNHSIESFAKQEWKNPEIFPLQLIWLSPDRLFLSQLGVPSLTDSSKVIYTTEVNNLKSQFMDILFDLKRFYFSDIYTNISKNYKVVNKKDVVMVTFNTITNSDTIRFEYFFGLNGLCLKINSYSPSKNLKVETIPHFNTSKTKWIIGSWEVKMYTENEINTGYFVDINFKEKESILIPSEITLSVQRKTDIGKTFNEILKFRNFLFDQSLQYIEQ